MHKTVIMATRKRKRKQQKLLSSFDNEPRQFFAIKFHLLVDQFSNFYSGSLSTKDEKLSVFWGYLTTGMFFPVH